MAEFADGKAKSAFRTIGEVSEALNIKPHVLRYWEQQFSLLKPMKRSGGRRLYRPGDIEMVEEIDRLNILNATFLAMQRALKALPRVPRYALIDGNRIPKGLPCPAEAVVKGDGRSLSIAAASIVAKVTRDRLMADLAREWPGYGWERNAGYGVAAHAEALRNLGVTPHHRRSFRPVHNILYQDKNSSD